MRLKRRHILFRTRADAARAKALLEAQTVKGPASADSPLGALQDTVRKDAAPFRGEVRGAHFKLTRRVRGRRMRVQLEGTLEEKPDGTTEVRASMAPPPAMLAGLYGGTAAGLLVALTMALSGGLVAGPAALVAVLVLAHVLNARLFDREVSQTFRALREAIPEDPGAPVLEPVVAVADQAPPPVADARVPDAAKD